MTEQYSLDLDEAQFAKMLFDHVREMSKEVAGVTRQGYGPLETQVLEYLKGIGGKLDLDIQTDLAGNVWKCKGYFKFTHDQESSMFWLLLYLLWVFRW